MKREYFGMLFIVTFVGLFFLAEYFFGEAKIMDYLSRYIVVWIVAAYSIGQYSMKFPKSF